MPVSLLFGPKVMLVRLAQPLKASSPIVVTPSGIAIFVSLMQDRKAALPMLATLSGIVMPVSLEHSAKASYSILVTGFPSMVPGITNSPEADVLQRVMMTSPSYVT